MNRFNIPWRTTALAALFGCVSLVTASASAATPEPPGLFSTLPGKSQAVLPEQAIEGRSRAVQINYARLRNGRFFVNLPGGVSFEAVRDLQQELGQNRFAWVGHANDHPDSRVIIGVSGDATAGTFAYQGRLFKLEPRANGAHILSEVETGDPAPELDPIPVADTTSPDAPDTGGATTAADGGPMLDVLVAYTPRIEFLLGADGADALIILAVAESNQAYANSGMSPRLNLVHTVLTNYTESGDMGTDLSRLRGTGDGDMDELHALRDSYGADLVSLIEDEPAYCGIAYVMASLSTGFASAAFSVVHHDCATGYYSFAHEIGHNQGAHHDHANAGSAIYPYAYGHQDPDRAFRTVMAYNCSGGCSRIDQISNPAILVNGKPTGVLDYSNNALAIDNTAATVAGFRQQAAQNPPSPPSGLMAAATSHSTIDLDWTDTSADESGFDLERSTDDGINFTQVASLPANTTSYLDDNLLAETLYNYRARAWNSAGNSSYSNVVVAATDSAPPYTDQWADADMPVAGNVSGTYLDTRSDNGIYQTIQERQSGGRKPSRYAYLEHKWRFQVQPGDSIVLYADIQTATAADSFTFAYSTDNADYLSMFTVDADNSGAQQFTLPQSLSGPVYIRVKDNQRVAGDTSSHSVQIDHLLIRSDNGSGTVPPPNPPPVQTFDLSASGYKVKGRQSVSLTWSGTEVTEIDIYRDGSLHVESAPNTGIYNDSINRKGGGSYIYKVCEAGTGTCSNVASVIF